MLPANGPALSRSEWIVLSLSELLVKLALLVPIAAALRNRIATATGFDRSLLLWRYETATATIRFLDASLVTPVRGTAP